MTDIPNELLDSIRSASACLVDIRALAGTLDHLDAGRMEPMLLELAADGEDWAVSRLLQVCAFNGVKLDPGVLCRCIGVCEEMVDSAPCFALQDGRAVQPLLVTAGAEELTLERQIYAARLAAELTVKFDLEPQPVRKILWKLEHALLPPEHQMLISQTLQLLDKDATAPPAYAVHWIEFQLADLLPERRPRAIVGGDYTVRRPIPKLGRNDPCHCGSGKKYKRCCYISDQKLLRDASQYAGATRSELKSKPGLVNDPAVILDLRPYELKRLDPSALSENQLLSGYRRALDFGLRELAFEMLLECERRPSEHEFDQGHFEDLIERVLATGDLDLARKIRDHCRQHEWWRPHAIQFRFDLLEHPERFEALEYDCRKTVCEIEDEETEVDEPLVRLAHDFAARHPALTIVFARAAIASHPDRHFDNEILLETIRDARVDLDLEPWNDPAQALFDWIDDRDLRKEKAQAESKEIEQLSTKLEATLAALDDKKQSLREMEQSIRMAGSELEKVREANAQHSGPDIGAETSTRDKQATRQRLSGQVEKLKAEIGEQQLERRQLRKLLADERKKVAALSAQTSPAQPAGPDQNKELLEPSGRPLIPEYADTFRKTCASLPPPLAAKAILAAGRFAAHDQAIWRQTKPIERLPKHYRIRLGLDHRMILNWLPGKALRILDVIPRQDLESWIKRHG